ncbi:polysaccharide biosynthesis C-terminal domain-containing protein [uncultured Draconibacterium sp.]|uniref:lipopolysaccharide biosynthesis protein n=1 Tax=uncultured Draconibacterium sp. TaxID=1573823 RepID=UPI0032605C41
MGIIIKQSIKGGIWSYLGLLVGYVNVGVIMPNFFRTDQIGLMQLFLALSTLFSNFSSLGFTGVIHRMFPEFRNTKHNHHGFLFLLVSTGLFGFVLSTVAFFLFKDKIIAANAEKSPLLVEYIFLLIPLIFFRIFFFLLNNYNKVLYDAVTGAFWNDFIHKIINLSLIILFSVSVIDFREFFYGYLFSLSLPVIPLITVMYRRGEFTLTPDFGYLKKPLVKEMIIVAVFGLVNGLSGVVTTNLDKIFINKYLSLSEVGVFSVCALFATVINIPSRATANISTGILAQAWKSNDRNKIESIFKKASLNQTIIGTLILGGIIVNLKNIFQILPEIYSNGKWVVVLYSLAILIRVSTTTSGNIIITSKYYKIQSIIILSQILVSILLQIILIPLYGITGAALAVLLTIVYRTIVVLGFIRHKMGMFCYSVKHIFVLIIAGIVTFCIYKIPDFEMLIPNILLKSILLLVIYSLCILFFKISAELSQLYIVVKDQICHFLKR